MKTMRLAIASALLLALAPGCTMLPAALPSSPAAVSEQTMADEQAALAVTLAYTAAARAAALAIETGVVSDRAAIARIGELNDRAHKAVKAAERAYRAGNAASFSEALAEANAAVELFLASVKGSAR